jgi:Fas apoptotic inhibitory molecule (FAIM1)
MQEKKNMTKKAWTVNLEDGKHLVELEHGYFSGKKVIYIDNIRVVEQQESVRSFLNSDTDHLIKIGDHEGIVHIRTNGLTFSFDLSVDGYSISTGKQVFLSKPLPSWGWWFVGVCALIPYHFTRNFI